MVSNITNNLSRIITGVGRTLPEFSGTQPDLGSARRHRKHETESTTRSEAADFNPHLRGHIEAQIANIADELAYTTPIWMMAYVPA